jgi:hypothetical protein
MTSKKTGFNPLCNNITITKKSFIDKNTSELNKEYYDFIENPNIDTLYSLLIGDCDYSSSVAIIQTKYNWSASSLRKLNKIELKTILNSLQTFSIEIIRNTEEAVAIVEYNKNKDNTMLDNIEHRKMVLDTIKEKRVDFEILNQHEGLYQDGNVLAMFQSSIIYNIFIQYGSSFGTSQNNQYRNIIKTVKDNSNQNFLLVYDGLEALFVYSKISKWAAGLSNVKYCTLKQLPDILEVL